MKQLIAVLTLTTSLIASANSVPQDFLCYSANPSEQIEVRYERGELTYSTGREVEVRIGQKSDTGRTLTLSGVATNLVFAGGGTQTVKVVVNRITETGAITIHTKTFYQEREMTLRLACSI